MQSPQLSLCYQFGHVAFGVTVDLRDVTALIGVPVETRGPCSGSQPLADVVMHVERGYRMEAPEGCPKEIYDIMTAAWQLNADARPAFSEVQLILDNLRAITV